MTDPVLDRISAVDTGPYGLGATAALDPAWRERRTVDGPLADITVLVKDSIDVAGLPTTGGSRALVESIPARDADAIASLRAAGAGILGKTHLQELCGWVTFASPSGWSELGRLPRNPHGHLFPVGGSSSGSGVAAAAGLSTVTIGTDTGGSILSPSVENGVFGIRPSTGLVSTHGHMPVTHAQDTSGPLGRRVRDIAAVLGAMSGGSALRYVEALDSTALAGARIGLALAAVDDDARDLWADTVGALQEAGADVVPLGVRLQTDGVGDPLVPAYDFRTTIGDYFDGLPSDAPVRSFEQLYRHYSDSDARQQPYGIGNIELSSRLDVDLHRSTRDALWAREHDDARRVLDGLHARGIEAVLFPHAAAAYLASKAGYPAIALPAGMRDGGRPFGVTLASTVPLGEQRLLDLAASWEARD